jgi:hypothetical protein
MFYPGGSPTLGPVKLLSGLADINATQLMGAVGGGIIGALISSVVTSVLPSRKTKDYATIASIGLVPAMAIAGWFLFKEGFTYEFDVDEV